MITLVLNVNDVRQTMVDLITSRAGRGGSMWGSFHVDMLHGSNIGRPLVDGVKTPYEILREGDTVDCVLLTVEEFKALTGKEAS